MNSIELNSISLQSIDVASNNVSSIGKFIKRNKDAVIYITDINNVCILDTNGNFLIE